MPTRVNPNLAMFITNLRSKKEDQKTEEITKTCNDMAKAGNNQTLSNMLKYLYLAVNEYKIDPFKFINACAMPDRKIKRIGYLGAQMLDEKYIIMMINTIQKDLRSIDTRSLALTYLGNCSYQNESFSELKNYICLHNGRDRHYNKTVLVYKYLNNTNISFIGNSEGILYIKLQMAINEFHKSNTAITYISETELNFLTSAFLNTKNHHLKIKLLQLYNCFPNFKNEELFKIIEKDVIHVGMLKKSRLEIALSIEACRYLYRQGYQNSRVNAFLFRLIESRIENLVYFGLKLAGEYNIYESIALEKIFKLGLHVDICLDTLLKLINSENAHAIYKRKAESELYMEACEVSQDKINEIWLEVIKRMFEVVEENFRVMLYEENPEICHTLHVSHHLSENGMSLLFEKVKTFIEIKYFELIYQIVENLKLDIRVYSTIFSQHLKILIDEENCDTLPLIQHICALMLEKGDFSYNRDLIMEAYDEIFLRKAKFISVFNETISFFNFILDKKIINLGEKIFIEYSFTDMLQINDKYDIPNDMGSSDTIILNICYDPVKIQDIIINDTLNIINDRKSGIKKCICYELPKKEIYEISFLVNGDYMTENIFLYNTS
ncbi:hypothetical protein TCON_1670 [Astathelohania contejeani]|uniref:Clathrin/coatomer adaptor adaptin-like N-terminal domain-containing protein n=1 Tax=Astathelohania contejeani TaxID=164912 RepID=A0ABQ7HY79_9MICR|nr:hypothetical protein TCON_1670 [Thelohania contejeani]